jgi:Ca2+-binding EF-hand superfamily protein
MKAAYAKVSPTIDSIYQTVAPVVIDAVAKITPKHYSNIPTDARVDRWVKRLGLSHDHVLTFYSRFVAYDADGKGMITNTDFSDKIVQLKSTVLIEAIYDLMDTQKAGWISFGEYVDICCTFSCFECVDLIRYCFFVLDREKLGYVDKTEIKHFIKNIWEGHVSSDLMDAMNYLDLRDQGDGRFSFENISTFHTLYPSVFYPAFRLQMQIQRVSLGITWWDNKKLVMADAQKDLAMAEKLKEQQRLKKESEEETMSQEEMVYQRMGPIRYYLLPCLREGERQKIVQMAALAARLDNLTGH